MNIDKTINDYNVLEHISSGSYAEVWLAIKDKTKYALKILLNSNGDGIDIGKYEKEVNSWKKANGHPNIIAIHDNFLKNGKYIIVLDYADGGSLKNKKFSIDETLEIAVHICNGVDHIHKKRIIHRDIKPANILLKDGIPCLGDFGMARELDLTQSTIIGGSENYFSPELADAKFNGIRDYKRSIDDDLWAVAVTFYQIVAGAMPFLATGKIINVEREKLTDNFPTEFIDFFDKAFQREKSQRFSSINEMLKSLKKIKEERFRSKLLVEVRGQVKKEFDQTHEAELIQLKNTNRKLEHQLITAAQKIEKIESDLNVKNKEIKNLEKQIVQLNSSVSLIKEKPQHEDDYYRQKFGEENIRLISEAENLNKMIAQFASEVNTTKKDLGEAKKTIKSLTLEKKRLSNENLNIDSKLRIFNAQITEKDSMIKELNKRISIKNPSEFFLSFGKLLTVGIMILLGLIGFYYIFVKS